jgi:putative tryptophan/tyrosine transport system substrate-binding protein
MNRRALLALLVPASTLGPLLARARTAAAAVHRVGFLFGGTRDQIDEFKKGWWLLKSLAQLGYVEGRNLSFEWRCLDGDFSKLSQMAVELVRARVDVLICDGTAVTRALQAATRIIPIVTAVSDPVASGFARSLGQPGGNVTGICTRHPETPSKMVDLLRRVVPGLDRIVIIADTSPLAKELLRPYEAAAKAAGLVADVRFVESNGFEHVFMEMKGSRVKAMLLAFGGGSSELPEEQVAKLAIRHRVATISHALTGDNDPTYVEKGGLMTFSMIASRPYEELAAIIDKIFRGMKPTEIPWQLPDRSYFAINLRTAKALGLRVPPDLVLRADKVVE